MMQVLYEQVFDKPILTKAQDPIIFVAHSLGGIVLKAVR